MTQISNTITQKNGQNVLLLTLIAESHIGIIYNKKSNRLFLDIFSCKYYDFQKVVKILKDLHFNIIKTEVASRGIHHNDE